MLQHIDIQIPTDTLKYQGCLEEPKLAILAHCAPVGEDVWKTAKPPNVASVSQNKGAWKHFRCSWFTTEPYVHLRVVQST